MALISPVKLGHDITFQFDNDDEMIYEMTEDFIYDTVSILLVVSRQLARLSPELIRSH
jgi:hypothetical protein